MQEKTARTQAEQRSIALLTEKKDWQTTLESRETSIQELQKRVIELEEKEADLTLELKVRRCFSILIVQYYYYHLSFLLFISPYSHA